MSYTFSSQERKSYLESMKAKEFDLLIVGGGITGAGIALDAATRGMKTALVEMQDFAAGTSSRSTKLVHGGLRYLKQFEVKMVAEVGKERAIVYENGPHVTTPEWMLLPIHEGGTFGRFSTSIGLRVYDYLAGVKKSERRSMLSKEEVLAKVPEIKKEGLKGGGYYVEYRTDDARLTIEVMKKAIEKGVNAANYTKVEEFIYKDGKAVGVLAVDQIDGEAYEIYAKKIVIATGPWVDSLREKDRSKTGKSLHITKGIHLVFDGGRFPLKQAVYFDTPDGRMVFAIPRDGKTYVGTTDTNYKQDLKNPRMTVEDRDYVINAINYMFPNLKITPEDVESSWAGLRPLIHEDGKDPSEISRKDEIWISNSGLITIAGGKLTGYRKMAEDVVNLVSKKMQEEGLSSYPDCQTKYLPISGGDVGGSQKFPRFVEEKTKQGVAIGLTENEARLLSMRYGSNVDKVYQIIKNNKYEAESFQLPIGLYGALIYSITHEMTVKPIDFFIRRTGAIFFDIHWVHQWKDAVIECMAQKLDWSEEQKQEYRTELEDALRNAVVPLENE